MYKVIQKLDLFVMVVELINLRLCKLPTGGADVGFGEGASAQATLVPFLVAEGHHELRRPRPAVHDATVGRVV